VCIGVLQIELPPPPRVLSSHWYAFLCLLDVVAVVDAEFVPLLALNALARCFVLEPRSGNTRTIDTATIFNAPQFLAAIRAAGASVQLRKRAFGASVGESTAALLAAANAAAAAEVADTRDLRSAQEVAYAESLAVDQQRVQLRERLQRRRAAAIAHRDERLKRVIAVPVPCAVRVRLPNGALIESVFDRDADQVAALLDFVVIEASLQLGDTFDIANYQLFSLYPKRYIAGELADGSSDPSAALTLVDAVSAAAGADRRVLLILEER
jgi:hypothetical protein